MPLAIFASIRGKLILLVLLAVLPALAIILHTGRELRDQVVADAENFALHQVQTMAAQHERVVDNPPWLFIVHDLNPRAMSRRVTGFIPAQSWFTDLVPVNLQ